MGHGDENMDVLQRLDAIVAAIRGLEKIGDVMLPEEAAGNDRQGQDDDLADLLDRIDGRIEELARERAAEMVAEGAGQRGSAPGVG